MNEPRIIPPEEARALLAAATPGPWAIWADLDFQGFRTVGEASGVIPEGEVFLKGEHNPTAHAYIDEDADLIAAAPDLAHTAAVLGDEVATVRAKVAEQETTLETLRDYWLQPTEPNSFYLNGFPTRIDQLADLFSEEAAATLRAVGGAR
jgi:hypothetical protein